MTQTPLRLGRTATRGWLAASIVGEPLSHCLLCLRHADEQGIRGNRSYNAQDFMMTWSTVIAVAVFSALFAASFLLWAVFLGWGARWARIAGVTRKRVLLATLLVFIFRFLWAGLASRIHPGTRDEAILLTVIYVVLGIAISCAVIARVFKARFFRAVQAWLVTLVPHFGMLAIALLVIRPFVFEAFTMPSNAMAPTLLGPHWQAMCPTCGGTAYGSSPDEFGRPESDQLVICENFHLTRIHDFDEKKQQGDCILVNKFLTARRWDLIVLRYPDDPSVLYVMRLVGLPDEEVTIQDGFVWIDGEKLTPPESISGGWHWHPASAVATSKHEVGRTAGGRVRPNREQHPSV